MKKIFCIILLSACVSCKKDWLNERSDRSKMTPSTLEDFRTLLTNEILFNMGSGFTGEGGTDNYYLLDESYDALPEGDRNTYSWSKDIFVTGTGHDWNLGYQRVYVANAVLEGLNKIKDEQGADPEWKTIRGTALFFRANALNNIAQEFAAPYSEHSDKPGIPVRKGADVSEPISRSSLEETYAFILDDLKEAASLLPFTVRASTMPTSTAAQALLARVYTSMRKYDDALVHADSALLRYSILMDYNTIDATAAFPFLRFNEEVIWEDQASAPVWFSMDQCRIDSTLFSSYDINDLRKELFYQDNGDGTHAYRGSYDGESYPFAGLATDELLLIRAECLARNGQTEKALNDLNMLLEKRWRQGTFVPVEVLNEEDALRTILAERRKELIFRNIRWSDLRRLNLEAGHETTLTRQIHGNIRTLDANSPNYILPIPADVITASGLEQNKRID